MNTKKCKNNCVHSREIPGDAHLRCNNIKAKVKGNPIGIKGGWFKWPFNFDPVWLESCDGYSNKKKDKLPEQKFHPLIELLSLLK